LSPLPSLQLNIGIIAACASFLKPLVGRLLKINSSAGYSYPETPYGRSGNTPHGLQTIGSKYANRRRTADVSHIADEFELHTKARSSDEGPQVVTSVEGARGQPRRASPNYSTEGVDRAQSDTNSEEIILQKQDAPNDGIMMTRDISVRYSTKQH
jgi:hypothetical protein